MPGTERFPLGTIQEDTQNWLTQKLETHRIQDEVEFEPEKHTPDTFFYVISCAGDRVEEFFLNSGIHTGLIVGWLGELLDEESGSQGPFDWEVTARHDHEKDDVSGYSMKKSRYI